MKVYIQSTGNISPQNSLEADNLFQIPVKTNQPYFKSIEPDYDGFVDTKMIRRMSRIIKMGVAAAITCLRKAGIEQPGAILTASAYGCLEDTSSFLRRMIEFDEKLLSPTAFIQSTHNTVGAQIALLLKCHQYNNTIVHRAFSFENALIESELLLQEGMGHVLVGAIDEITDDRQAILSRFGLYRKWDTHLNESTGNIAGEGAAFFLLDLIPGNNPLAIIKDVKTYYQPENFGAAQACVLSLLKENQIKPDEIGLILFSGNSKRDLDELDEEWLNHVFSGIPKFPFKSLCGDYPTASGFALWLAARLLKDQKQPDWMPAFTIPLQYILILHRSLTSHLSLLLISVY